MKPLDALLASPIDGNQAATNPTIAAFLNDLQANILKGHGRWFTGNVFLSFAGMSPGDVAAIVRSLGSHCTSAAQQLRTNHKYPPHLDGGTVRCLFLSACGYRALGALAKVPAEPSFAAGMEAAGPGLGDPPRSAWNQVGWRGPPPDAMFLVADADADKVTADLEQVEGWLSGSAAQILVIERGLQ